MTVAVSAAIAEGAEAIICASTGNTAASAAAYAARAGLRGAVIVPEGKIATGKLAQALMHGARVIALRGNFDEALALVRELAKRHPISLVNSVNDFRIEGQKTGAFEVCDELGEAPDVLCIPVGNAGNVTSWWKGFQEYGVAPALHGYQAEGAAPLVRGRAGRVPRDGRLGDPDRQPGALGGRDERVHRPRAARCGLSRTPRSSTPTRCSARARGCSASRRRPRRWPGCSSTAPRAGCVCVLTGHGLKDPQTAMNRAGSVVPVRARHRERREGRARVNRRRVVRVPASSANLGPGYDVLAAALDLQARAGGRGDAATFAVECDLPGVPLDRDQPVRPGLRAAAPGRRRPLHDPLGDPAGGRAGLERRGDRGGAVRRRPHVRAGRAAVRAGRRARGTPGQRGRGAARRVRDLRRRAGARSSRRPAWRGCWRSRASRCRRRRPGRRMPDEVPLADAVHNVGRASLLVLGPGARRLLADRARAERRAPPAAPALALPAVDGAGGARRRRSARSGRRSRARGRRCCSGRTGSRPGRWWSGCAAEAPDCDVRRVTFAPGGADVNEL